MKRLIVIAIGILVGTTTVQAQQYPTRPIKMVVPYAAGGPYDAIVRLISDKASTFIGQPIIIENRGGAGGVPATNLVAKAAPDGYSLVTVSPGQTSIAISAATPPPYDPQKDLVPVIRLVEDRLILLVSNDLPVKNVADLVKYMKDNPGKLFYSSASVGSMTHLVMELFKKTYAVEATHVPYKGTAPALMGILTGDVSMAFSSPGGAKAFLDDGRMRALVAAASTRSAVVPSVPTMSEMGFANLESPLWYGVMAPKGTPPEIVKKVYDAYAEALKTPEVRARLTTMGVEITSGGPDDLAKLIDVDIRRWRDIVKEANLTLE